MFADSLLDSSWANSSRRGWSTFLSFALQAGIVSSLLLSPLIYTSGLPGIISLGPSPVLAPSAARPAASPAHSVRTTGNHAPASGLFAPTSIPSTIAPGDEVAILSAPDMGDFGTRDGAGDRASGNEVDHGTGAGFDLAVPPPAPAVVRPPRVSRIMEGNLIYRLQPDYPTLARLAHMQGTVLLHAVISKQGTIENLQVVSGPPLLIKAAIDAVRQWRYRPYLLNGDPVEVDTEITVNFLLARE